MTVWRSFSCIRLVTLHLDAALVPSEDPLDVRGFMRYDEYSVHGYAGPMSIAGFDLFSPDVSSTAIVYTRRSRLVYTTHDRLVYTRHDRPMYTTRDRLMYTTWARVATLLRESYPGGVTDGAATHEPFA